MHLETVSLTKYSTRSVPQRNPVELTTNAAWQLQRFVMSALSYLGDVLWVKRYFVVNSRYTYPFSIAHHLIREHTVQAILLCNDATIDSEQSRTLMLDFA